MPPKASPQSGQPSKGKGRNKRQQQLQSPPRSSEQRDAGRKREPTAASASGPSSSSSSQGGQRAPSTPQSAARTGREAATAGSLKPIPSSTKIPQQRTAGAPDGSSEASVGLNLAKLELFDDQLLSLVEDAELDSLEDIWLDLLVMEGAELDLAAEQWLELGTGHSIVNAPLELAPSEREPRRSHPDYLGCMRSRLKPSDKEIEGMKRRGYRLVHTSLTKESGELYCPAIWWI
jgi:hypothetical protein